MLPPTAWTLRSLAAYSTVDDAMAQERDLTASVTPVLVEEPDGSVRFRLAKHVRVSAQGVPKLTPKP
jgi:hypothetical protein